MSSRKWLDISKSVYLTNVKYESKFGSQAYG